MKKLYRNGIPISTDGDNPYDLLWSIAKDYYLPLRARISKDGKRINMIGYGEVVLCYEYGQPKLDLRDEHFEIC